MDMFATTQPEKRHEFKVSRMGMSFRELGAKDTARKEMNEELSLLSEVEHEAA